jgi:hypothetical protein
MASFAGRIGPNVGCQGITGDNHMPVSAKLAEKVGIAISMS